MELDLRRTLRGVVQFFLLNVTTAIIFYIVFKFGYGTLYFDGLAGMASANGLWWKIPLFMLITFVVRYYIAGMDAWGAVRSVWGTEQKSGFKLYIDNTPLYFVYVLFISWVFIFYWGVPTTPRDLIAYSATILLWGGFIFWSDVRFAAQTADEYDFRKRTYRNTIKEEIKPREEIKPIEEIKPKIVPDQDVESSANAIWAGCPRKMIHAADPALVCETDYCCVDMVVSHNWKGASAHAPKCDNEEMIDFILKLQRNQLYRLRQVNLDEILPR